jgi:hypothetical protein
MKINYKQWISGSLSLAIALLFIVPVTDFVVSQLDVVYTSQNTSDEYSNHDIFIGVISELIRAFITVYLYSMTLECGKSILHGIKFGLLYSALIASLYIFLGALYFNIKNPVKFIIVDTAILFIQGIVTGIALYFIFKPGKTNIKPF